MILFGLKNSPASVRESPPHRRGSYRKDNFLADIEIFYDRSVADRASGTENQIRPRHRVFPSVDSMFHCHSVLFPFLHFPDSNREYASQNFLPHSEKSPAGIPPEGFSGNRKFLLNTAQIAARTVPDLCFTVNRAVGQTEITHDRIERCDEKRPGISVVFNVGIQDFLQRTGKSSG